MAAALVWVGNNNASKEPKTSVTQLYSKTNNECRVQMGNKRKKHWKRSIFQQQVRVPECMVCLWCSPEVERLKSHEGLKCARQSSSALRPNWIGTGEGNIPAERNEKVVYFWLRNRHSVSPSTFWWLIHSIQYFILNLLNIEHHNHPWVFPDTPHIISTYPPAFPTSSSPCNETCKSRSTRQARGELHQSFWIESVPTAMDRVVSVGGTNT